MSSDRSVPQDPARRYPRPESTPQGRTDPGPSDRMDPVPDHGERTYRDTGRLAGRVTLVTDGGSGIGRAVVLAFAREGADVLFCHPADGQEDAAESVRLVEEAGRRAVAVAGDVREEGFCAELVGRTVTELGALDVLVNNAGYQPAEEEGLAAISTDRFDRVMKTDVYAMFWLCQAALPHLRPGSSIINTASVQVHRPTPHLLDYAASKGAIVTFTQGLARELAPRGVRVNAVAHGPAGCPSSPPPCRPGRSPPSVSGHRWAGPPNLPRWHRCTCSWPRPRPAA